MSIKPLDLQTLFMKMAQVGKEQATIQKSVENQQNREANHIIKEENDRDHSVNKTEEDKEINKVKDKEEENSNSNKREKNKEEKKDKDKDSAHNYFTDPERGHNIDISG